MENINSKLNNTSTFSIDNYYNCLAFAKKALCAKNIKYCKYEDKNNIITYFEEDKICNNICTVFNVNCKYYIENNYLSDYSGIFCNNTSGSNCANNQIYNIFYLIIILFFC